MVNLIVSVSFLSHVETAARDGVCAACLFTEVYSGMCYHSNRKRNIANEERLCLNDGCLFVCLIMLMDHVSYNPSNQMR